MGPKLVDVGYQQVSSTGYQPQAGDVAVVPGYIGDVRCGGAPCGHVAMYNGTQWVSDTNQGSRANPYGARPLSGDVRYYRN
jgi:type VI secretion system secreted protein VgrG